MNELNVLVTVWTWSPLCAQNRDADYFNFTIFRFKFGRRCCCCWCCTCQKCHEMVQGERAAENMPFEWRFFVPFVCSSKNGLLWFRDFCIAVQLISAHTRPKALCCTWFEQKQRSSLGAIEISLVRKCFESSPKRKIGRIHIVCTWHVHDSANWIKTHD